MPIVLFASPSVLLLIVLLCFCCPDVAIVVGILIVILLFCACDLWTGLLTVLLCMAITCVATIIITRLYLRYRGDKFLPRLTDAMDKLPDTFTPSSSNPERAALETVKFLYSSGLQLFPPSERFFLRSKIVNDDSDYYESVSEKYKNEKKRRKRLALKEKLDRLDDRDNLQHFLEECTPYKYQWDKSVKDLFRTAHSAGYTFSFRRRKR